MNSPLIAIVDDDESIREATKSLMNSLGLVTETFLSAESFLASNYLQLTSCLIADVQMPGMTGIELHNRLVASGTLIPTILITAYPDARLRTRALQAGIVCYLIKPFAEDDLLGCIRLALEHNNSGVTH